MIVKNEYKFNYTNIGHGSYLISGNGYSWSHGSADKNSKMLSFSFTTGDLIAIEYNSLTKDLTFRKYNNSSESIVNKNQSYTMKISEYQNDDELCPCVNMSSTNDEVEIVGVPSDWLNLIIIIQWIHMRKSLSLF